MRRFLIFPPLFAVWFLAARVGLWVVNALGASLALRFSPPVDIYYHTFPLSHYIQIFLPAPETGAVVGCLFAAVDFALRRGRQPNETAFQLVRYLVKSGTVAVALVLLCQGAMLLVEVSSLHRRYHTYASEMTWLSWISFIQVLLLLGSVLWAMVKTLRQQTQ